jgi:hypothetical protein
VSVGIFPSQVDRAVLARDHTNPIETRFGEKAKPVGLECSMIDKVGKRIFDPAKIIVDPSQIMRRKPAAIRRISPDPLQPIKIPSHYDFLLITGEMASSPFR